MQTLVLVEYIKNMYTLSADAVATAPPHSAVSSRHFCTSESILVFSPSQRSSMEASFHGNIASERKGSELVSLD